MFKNVQLICSVIFGLCCVQPILVQEMLGQEINRAARAAFVELPPVIDGIVDDTVWDLADPITDFIQAEPLQGTPASEKTIVRLVYTNTAIYVGAILYDSEPDRILVTDSRRDSGMGDSDSFQVIFDTYLDRQNGFVFGTNPSGVEFDGQVSNEGQGGGGGGRDRQTATVGSGAGFNLNWDATWTVRTYVNEIGWMAEFEIPLRSPALRCQSADLGAQFPAEHIAQT